MLSLIAAASIAADQNASVDTAYFDRYVCEPAGDSLGLGLLLFPNIS